MPTATPVLIAYAVLVPLACAAMCGAAVYLLKPRRQASIPQGDIMKLLSAIALGAMACLAVPLAGCTTLSQATTEIGNAVSTAKTVYQQVKNYYTDAPKAVYALKGGFIIVQSAVANFKTTECPAVNSQPWCATVVPELRVYNTAAENAIATAKAFVLANPKADASTFYNAAVTATEAYAKFATTIGVKTP